MRSSDLPTSAWDVLLRGHALTSQRQTLEQEQRSETVAMEMVSGGCVGQGREKEREERCEQDTEVARGRPYGCGLAQVMCAWAGGARVQSDRVTRWREKSF
jgi:hypothetical protein